MAIDISGFTSGISTWTSSLMFWVIFTFCAGFAAIVGLMIRKKRRLNKPTIELYLKGNGDFGFNVTRGGWLKKKLTFFGLWDYGSEKMYRMKDNTPVYDVSHKEYKDINGKNGLFVLRDPYDPKFCFPIEKLFITKNSQAALVELAPAVLREAAVMDIEATDSEMKTKWEQYAPLIAIGFVGIVLVFSILLIAQYGKHNIDSSKELLKYVTDKIVVIGNQVSTSKGASP